MNVPTFFSIRDTHTDIHTDIDTDIDTDIQTYRQTHIELYIYRLRSGIYIKAIQHCIYK